MIMTFIAIATINFNSPVIMFCLSLFKLSGMGVFGGGGGGVEDGPPGF